MFPFRLIFWFLFWFGFMFNFLFVFRLTLNSKMKFGYPRDNLNKTLNKNPNINTNPNITLNRNLNINLNARVHEHQDHLPGTSPNGGVVPRLGVLILHPSVWDSN